MFCKAFTLALGALAVTQSVLAAPTYDIGSLLERAMEPPICEQSFASPDFNDVQYLADQIDTAPLDVELGLTHTCRTKLLKDPEADAVYGTAALELCGRRASRTEELQAAIRAIANQCQFPQPDGRILVGGRVLLKRGTEVAVYHS